MTQSKMSASPAGTIPANHAGGASKTRVRSLLPVSNLSESPRLRSSRDQTNSVE